MIGLATFALAAVQLVSCQGPPPPPADLPPQCRAPPQGVDKPQDCCKIPPFFTEKDLEECGFKKVEGELPERRGPPDCSKQLCIMKKYNMIKDEDAIDYDAVSKYVESWAAAHPEFAAAAAVAKERCVGRPLRGPPQICEANKIVFCITSNLFKNCPKWETTEGCANLKIHIEECAKYFPEP